MQTSLNIKEPGLNVFPLGVERYVVNGGGLTGVQILPDDEIEIINDEGNQICEITVFNKDGKSELGILSLKESKNSSEIKKILFNKNIQARTNLGMLWVNMKKNSFLKKYSRDDYHMADYNLFWLNMRDNLNYRLSKFN